MQHHAIIDKVRLLKKFDLNLLVVFEVLYTCKSGVKAAEVLSVTPPSISQSLVRLRSFFSDVLFVRQKNNLIPTTFAVNLHEHLQGGFDQLLNSLDYLSDSPIKKKVIIYCSPYAAIRILPFLVKKIEDGNLQFDITHISSDAIINSIDDILTYRKADIVLDTHPYYSFSTITEPYLIDETVAICRINHPRLGKTLTVEEMSVEKSTFLSVHSEMVKKTQLDISNFFGEREFSFSSSSVISLAAVVEHSDYVSFIPRWFANKFSACFNLKILDCNFLPDPVNFYMTYNKTSMRDKKFAVLIEYFKTCSQEISGK